MKIVSWNVNGIRAQVKKDFSGFIKNMNADIILLQETKATVDIVEDIGSNFSGYSIFANEAEKKGYSGTAIFSKIKPISEQYKIEIEEHDQEGRVNVLEFDNFYLVNVYVPNAGSGLKRLDYRKRWDKDFLNFNNELCKKKPVLIGGDFNVAHHEIDLARPKDNYDKTAGFTQVEIDGMDNYIGAGFIDTFRHFHPEEVAYTFWSMRMKARDRNVGWRIDYFLASPDLKDKLNSAGIHGDVLGSDHCPISVELDL